MLSQEVAVCMAGVRQCGSLKVRKCANRCIFTENLSAHGRESWWFETLVAAGSQRGSGAGLRRDPCNTGHSFFVFFASCFGESKWTLQRCMECWASFSIEKGKGKQRFREISIEK